MAKAAFHALLEAELRRIDGAKTAKRHERIIEGYEGNRAVIGGKRVLLFNSNDYLGLRLDRGVKDAEHAASERFGAGPGAVRFIAGTTRIHKELEGALARFHGREEAMLFSSAFAANMAVLHCLLKGQSKESLVHDDTIIISDELNHRSIIDGIRVAGFPKERKMIFRHLDLEDLRAKLAACRGAARRIVVVTDGVFSMLGEAQDIGKLQRVAEEFDGAFDEGVLTVVDDSHGVACYGATGRGTEEATEGRCDLLVATLGKGFGADGGYVVGDKALIDYLRESAATYIYSNPFSPGTAGAALAAVRLLESERGAALLTRLRDNIARLQRGLATAGFSFAAASSHPIQPLLVGDAAKGAAFAEGLFAEGILATPIGYPVVPKGRDEIRVQVSAAHSAADIDEFVAACAKVWKRL